MANGWWDLDGTIASCVAAYQPLNAESYEDSLIDLTGNGNDAEEAVVPDWNKTQGWYFSGSEYFWTNITPGVNQEWSMIVRFNRLEGNTSIATAAITGCVNLDGSSSFRLERRGSAGDDMVWSNGGTFTGSERQSNGVMAIAGANCYYNKSLIGTIPTEWADVALEIAVGGENYRSGVGRTINGQIIGSIQAWAVYSGNVSAYMGDLTDAINAIESPHEASIILQFDDCNSSQYSTVYPLLASKGLKATFNLISDIIGDAGSMTLAQIQEIYADGHDVANHSDTHPNFTELTQAQIESELTTCETYLNNNGMSRASRHVAYPYGAYDADTLAAMLATNMLTGRRAYGFATADKNSMQVDEICSADTIYELPIKYVRSDFGEYYTPVSTVTGWIDDAIYDNSTIILLFHRIVETPADYYDYDVDDFETILDYIVAQGVKTETITDWYTRYAFYCLGCGRIEINMNAQMKDMTGGMNG